MKSIKYRSGYKYQLAESSSTVIGIRTAENISTPFVLLNTDGILIIKQGYAWDGASGPTIDTKSSMRGSLVHDALYQLIRLGLLPESFRLRADEEAYKIWREDGMNPIRAWIWRFALNKFAAPAAKVGDRAVLVAP